MQASNTFYITSSSTNCNSNDCTRCFKIYGHCPADPDSGDDQEAA